MNTARGKSFILGPISALLGATLCLMTRSPAIAHAGQAAAICTFPFYAQVFQGPNTGMVLQGNVTLSIESSGNAFGILARDDGSQVGLVGQASGRALSVLLSLEGGQVSAIGTADGDVRACGFTTIFGPFVGPAIDAYTT